MLFSIFYAKNAVIIVNATVLVSFIPANSSLSFSSLVARISLKPVSQFCPFDFYITYSAHNEAFPEVRNNYNSFSKNLLTTFLQRFYKISWHPLILFIFYNSKWKGLKTI